MKRKPHPQAVALRPVQRRLLARLARAIALHDRQAMLPQDVLDKLLNALQQAADRPGSWEHDCFLRVFGEALYNV